MPTKVISIIILFVILTGSIQFVDAISPVVSIPYNTSDDNGDLFEFIGPSGVTTITIDGSHYVLLSDVYGQGFQIIDITDPYIPLAGFYVEDEADFDGSIYDALDGAYDVTTITIGTSHYALVAASNDDGVQIIDITAPDGPIVAASVFDDNKVTGSLYDALDDAQAITTISIGTSHYALVVATNDDGVQIIDITNPYTPIAAASVFDGDTDLGGDTFDALDGAKGITTITIDGFHYALVTANADDAIQIIDITDPYIPLVAASVFDDNKVAGSLYDTLDGAKGITTITIDGFHYALVTATNDDGLQIIDITDPYTPIAVASVFDGSQDINSDTFDAFDGAQDITAISFGTLHYALVASSNDDAIQIIDISDPYIPLVAASIFDGTEYPSLDYVQSITTITIDGFHYAVTATLDGLAVQIIDITSLASVEVVDEIVSEIVVVAADGTGAFISSFDGTDNGGTQFTSPQQIAVDSLDRIIVVNDDPGIIQIFDSNGNFIIEVDDSNMASAFFNPRGVAVDSLDNIIIIDGSEDIIETIDVNGNHIDSFDAVVDGSGVEAFIQPRDIAVDSNDRIIVTDSSLDSVQIFDSNRNFISSFDGTDNGGTLFTYPYGVAVDSNDRIIVTDVGEFTVQIFDSNGSFIHEIVGDTPFEAPRDIAVDSNDNIIVTDSNTSLVQIFDSTGTFIVSFDGTDNGGTLLVSPYGVEVDSNDNIIVVDFEGSPVQIFVGVPTPVVEMVEASAEPSNSTDEPVKKKGGNGGCGDCVPPTLGLNTDNKRLVDNGFSYNGNSVQVEMWHTEFPLITATIGEINTVEIIVYENQGINNMKMVQFGLGATEIGQPLHDLEVLIEVHLETFGSIDDIGIEKVIIKDKDNLIDTDTVFGIADVVKCQTSSADEVCVKVTLQYSYREATINNVMVVDVMDKPRNSQKFYFNDGIQIVGESLNPPPTYIISNKQTSQQTENLTLTLTRIDKVNHIWVDQHGTEYLQISSDRFNKIISQLDLKEFKKYQDSMSNVMTRLNSNFVDMVNYENIRAIQHFDSSLIQGTLDDSTAYVFPPETLREDILEILKDEIITEQVIAQEIMDDLFNPKMMYR